MSRQVIIIRNPCTDDGTFGHAVVDDGKFGYISLELPWRDNHNGLSCIPVGTYVCKIINSTKHGAVYEVMDVPERTMIEIHPASYAGDTTRGKRSDLLGCIAFGRRTADVDGQQILSGSKDAMEEFMAYMGNDDFTLTIINAGEHACESS